MKERIEGRIKCRKEQSDFIYGAVASLTGICSGAVSLICRVMVGNTQTDLCQRITLLAGLIVLWIYGGWSFSSSSVDKWTGPGMCWRRFSQTSAREEEIRQPEMVWEEKLFHRYQEGVVGRLESHLLECVHILGQRVSVASCRAEIFKRDDDRYFSSDQNPAGIASGVFGHSSRRSSRSRRCRIWLCRHEDRQTELTGW